MVSPYTAVGLILTVRGICRREDIRTNLEHLAHLVKAASWLSSLDLPVRLIAILEGAVGGKTGSSEIGDPARMLELRLTSLTAGLRFIS
jgi:hypothetical protein